MPELATIGDQYRLPRPCAEDVRNQRAPLSADEAFRDHFLRSSASFPNTLEPAQRRQHPCDAGQFALNLRPTSRSAEGGKLQHPTSQIGP